MRGRSHTGGAALPSLNLTKRHRHGGTSRGLRVWVAREGGGGACRGMALPSLHLTSSHHHGGTTGGAASVGRSGIAYAGGEGLTAPGQCPTPPCNKGQTQPSTLRPPKADPAIHTSPPPKQTQPSTLHPPKAGLPLTQVPPSSSPCRSPLDPDRQRHPPQGADRVLGQVER